jgi:hypothetical protein
MFKALTPIFAILIAIGLVLTYVRPTFLAVKATQNETKEYEEAIDIAKQLNQRLSELMSTRASFRSSDLDRLEVMVPDSLDEVSLVLDLDTLARTYDMLISEIAIQEIGGGQGERAASAALAEDGAEVDVTVEPVEVPLTKSYKATDISFTVSGTYEDFLAFLESAESSLMFLDVVKLEFDKAEEDLYAFKVTLRTYEFVSPEV